MQSSSPPSWYTLLIDRFQQRDHAILPFHSLFQSYEYLNKELAKSLKKNEVLQGQYLTLERTYQSLKSSTEGVTAETCQQLTLKLNQLQDEHERLKAVYQDVQQRQIRQQQDLDHVTKELNQSKERIQQLSDELEIQLARVKTQREQLREKDVTIQLIQDEYTAIQLELYKMTENHTKLVAENKELIDRWLKKKNEEAELMNASLIEINPPKVQIWDGEALKDLTRSPSSRVVSSKLPNRLSHRIQAHKESIISIACSNDGKWIATGSSDHTVRLWDVKTGTPGKTLMESTQGILCVDFDKSHHMILAGSSDHAIRLWEISSGKLQQSLTGHVGKVHSALFLNHQCVISGGHDRTIKIWDLNRGYCTKTIFTVSSCNTISTTDDQGSMIISGHLDGVLRLWDGRTSKCIKELNQIHQGSITSTMISSHGDYLLTLARDHRICVTDTRTFQPVTTIDNHRINTHWTKAMFSPDDQYIVSGNIEGQVKFWQTQSGQLLHTEQHDAVVYGVSWVPIHDVVVSGAMDGSLCLWTHQEI